MHPVLKRTLSVEIDKAYAELKAALTQKGCRTVSEDPPTHLIVKQGSLWGMSPASAKKTVYVALVPAESATQVTFSSRLSADWKNLTIVGCALAAVLAGICLWMAFDINSVIASGKATFWSWLVSANGSVDVSAAKAFVKLTEDLSVFLSVVVILEIAIAIYAHKRIDVFAEGIFDELAKNGAAAETQKKLA